MNTHDPAPWRERLAGIGDQVVSAALIVQCGVEWLLPSARPLRDEIDSAVAAVVLARDDVAVDRVVLHSLPVLAELAPGDVAALNTAHADWLYRLAVTGALIPSARRPRVHRLITGGSQRNFDLVDGIYLRKGAARWPRPAVAAAWEIVRGGGAATPLTSYDIEMDGPFGDSDPSVYL